ncbi:DUF4376 domain-containing protein [Pseudomonas sp. FSL W5-0299]|uniref:DUF4376 domain-containing protein n=1 Tax=Pseudomonas sp. FSL W5-0299 TaxID=1917484 RepID=UPI00098B1BAE|nr:DUF4376 domain-containing protein [Pseudomonas sp. FSL W5-0299]OOL39148.1 hypothetical protein BOO94_04235 [Pseudomonas sp. FSL W5-0299]
MKYVTFDGAGALKCRLIRGVNDIPEGAVEVDDDLWMRITQELDGVWLLDADGTVRKHERPALVLTEEDKQSLVTIERDRRIEAGVTFRGIHYQSRATDRENIAGAAQLGLMAVIAGAQPGDYRWSDPDKDFTWISTDNDLVSMDAHTVMEFGKVAASAKQALIFAARALKDNAQIPTDFEDDKWWPA